MSCKLNWYNLPKEINKIIKPYTNTKVYWYNLPLSLDKVYKEILDLKPLCNKAKKFQWFSLNKKAEIICELVGCLNTNEINFDVTSSDWGMIIDANSFKIALELQSGETTNTISNFSLIEGRLRCTITNIIEMYLNAINIINVNEISIAGLTRLGLQSNQITTFNPIVSLPSSLTNLDLALNQITTFNPTIPLPSSLISLGLNSNQITTFNPTIPLPSSLQFLGLGNNQIVTFNPTIPLPSSLQTLQLGKNQIVTFNPTIPLPLNLQTLELDNNQIVTFNPSTTLPSMLQDINLILNRMTTQGYTNSEPWANSMSVGTGIIKFNNNINSASGTNLVSILQSKGYTVLV